MLPSAEMNLLLAWSQIRVGQFLVWQWWNYSDTDINLGHCCQELVVSGLPAIPFKHLIVACSTEVWGSVGKLRQHAQCSVVFRRVNQYYPVALSMTNSSISFAEPTAQVLFVRLPKTSVWCTYDVPMYVPMYVPMMYLVMCCLIGCSLMAKAMQSKLSQAPPACHLGKKGDAFF